MNEHLAKRVRGRPRYSMADITTQIAVEFAKWAKLPPPESCPTSAAGSLPSRRRPSAKA